MAGRAGRSSAGTAAAPHALMTRNTPLTRAVIVDEHRERYADLQRAVAEEGWGLVRVGRHAALQWRSKRDSAPRPPALTAVRAHAHGRQLRGAARRALRVTGAHRKAASGAGPARAVAVCRKVARVAQGALPGAHPLLGHSRATNPLVCYPCTWGKAPFGTRSCRAARRPAVSPTPPPLHLLLARRAPPPTWLIERADHCRGAIQRHPRGPWPP